MPFTPGDSLYTYYLSDYCVSTNTSELSLNDDLLLFPNPSVDEIKLISNKKLYGQILLSDLSGKIILNKKIDENIISIDLNNYSSGIYFISLINSDKTIHRKFIKK